MFGATPIDTFLLAHPAPTSGNVSDLLLAYAPEARAGVAQELISRGIDARVISGALSWIETRNKIQINWPKIAGVMALVSASASAYHGYRRNQSIPWAMWWFLMGSIFPVFTPIIALAQGYGERKK